MFLSGVVTQPAVYCLERENGRDTIPHQKEESIGKRGLAAERYEKVRNWNYKSVQQYTSVANTFNLDE